MRTGVFHESHRSEEQLWDSPAARRTVAVFIVALLALPFYGGDYVLAMACIVGIHIIATLGLNITTGSTGQISLAHAAFLGVGCYTVAWFAKLGVPFYFALPLGGLLAAAIGILVGLPSLRVKGIYLAIATLAAHFILTFVFREWEPVTGGVPGTSIPRANLFGFEFIGDHRNFYLIYACVLIAALATRNLQRCYIGRAFIAVRDRDISAEILGVSLLHTKLLAFALGAFYAGVAGGLLGYFYGNITPEYFTITLSIYYLAAIIVGGATVLGSVLGAMFMTFVPEVLRLVAHSLAQWAPGVAGLLLPMGQVVFGLLIIVFLIFEPHGLSAMWTRVRRTFHLWPFTT
ncbi:branched-chain amino acid ABC transporter permease [Variovorax sp. YR216]|uniref:branched-chain amino acid ABC transporter permease n=1 Tax=Variovorax sp. YR216 TaxID=1882828 RepID=UPI000896461D|nr:branched-chain amino acid ABC transporter permease [Variovorax sp. YR216]SEB22001.1 amino acid/amide ABC transporter membrane protein 2, HAAT family [Variovorax sp. YR216]